MGNLRNVADDKVRCGPRAEDHGSDGIILRASLCIPLIGEQFSTFSTCQQRENIQHTMEKYMPTRYTHSLLFNGFIKIDSYMINQID